MTATAVRAQAPVEQLEVGAYTIPTDAPEADGTLAWDATTIVVVHARGGGECGLGYTYADVSTAKLIASKLVGVVHGRDAMAPQAAWVAMVEQTRNLGRPGITSMAIAAVDLAVWDLKARLLGLPLCGLLGMARERVPVYGSGGFTAYSPQRLASQLAGWVQDGIPRVKMKVGSVPDEDPDRVRLAREAIGPEARLFVDANGAYSRKQALDLAERFASRRAGELVRGAGVLRRSRGTAAAPRSRAAPAWRSPPASTAMTPSYFRRMLEAGAVDVLQADVTRCGGITELLRVGALCRAHCVPLSLHCGPSIHLHPAMALENFVHLEYFHDHVRIEHMLFDGVVDPVDGALIPDLERPGNGLELKRGEAEPYAA